MLKSMAKKMAYRPLHLDLDAMFLGTSAGKETLKECTSSIIGPNFRHLS